MARYSGATPGSRCFRIAVGVESTWGFLNGRMAVSSRVTKPRPCRAEGSPRHAGSSCPARVNLETAADKHLDGEAGASARERARYPGAVSDTSSLLLPGWKCLAVAILGLVPTGVVKC